MKTIEEKAKAYDEIIERANTMLAAGEVMYGKENNARQLITDIIPELAESEDERIRKALVKQFGGCIKNDEFCHTGFTYAEITAWLEKKKEQKPEFISISEMVSKYRNTDEYDGDGNYKGKPVNCMIRAYEQGIRDTLSKVKEQKPAEWSEEDETQRINTIIFLQTPVLRKVYQQSQVDKAVEWLRNLRPSWKPTAEQIGMVTRVCNGLHLQNSFDAEGMDVLLKQLEKIFWNTPDTEQEEHWKPTQEQMEALLVAIHCTPSDENMLISLYNDLLKLK